jgi:hypothetical protein
MKYRNRISEPGTTISGFADNKKNESRTTNPRFLGHVTVNTPCVEKMQFIFFVPPNEELEGTLHPQKFGCSPKNEGKRVHVPPDEKTCGHTDSKTCLNQTHFTVLSTVKPA